MGIYRRWSTPFTSAMWLVSMAAIWFLFAPIPMGGQSAYIMVNGNSMEPDFHLGDLVIVRQSESYAIGESVVYQNRDLGSKNVFHRIIDIQLGHYTLQGDNNDWIDAYRPTRDEIIGKLWVHIPRGGLLIQKMRSPLVMAILAGLIGYLLIISFLPERRKGKNRMKNISFRQRLASIKEKLIGWHQKHIVSNWNSFRQRPPKLPEISDNLLEAVIFTLGLVAFISLILAIVAFTRPGSRVTQIEHSYQQTGSFSYSANASGDVYDSKKIQSGDPIFPKLNCYVGVKFHYALIGNRLEDVKGSYQFAAIVSDPETGWNRSLPLGEAAGFNETEFDDFFPLDLCKIETLTQTFEEKAGAQPFSYVVTISPQVSISGSVEGYEFQDVYERGLMFRYDRTQFYIVRDENIIDPFDQSVTGFLTEENREPNIVSLLGIKAQVPALRLISLIALILSAVGLALLWQNLQKLSGRDQEEFIRVKFGAQLVEIRKTNFGTGTTMVDVSTIDDLAKLAELHNGMILHHGREGGHVYYVRGDGITYRFDLKSGIRNGQEKVS